MQQQLHTSNLFVHGSGILFLEKLSEAFKQPMFFKVYLFEIFEIHHFELKNMWNMKYLNESH